jgi:hypothetical protein
MVRVAETAPSVALVGSYVLEGNKVICTGLPYSITVIDGREMCRRHLLNGLYVFGSANSLLYRTKCLRGLNPIYDEDNTHADTEVCFRLLKNWDFGFVHQVLTYTRVRPDSLTDRDEDLQTCFPFILQLLDSHGGDLLAPEELRTFADQHLSRYYRFLAKSRLRSRHHSFWDYHRLGMAKAGHKLSAMRLTFALAALIGEATINPGRTVEKLIQIRHHAMFH